jgi:hypothetical protein
MTDTTTDHQDLPNKQGSADVTADDERKKFIAQNGENPLAQERAQDVPQPSSNELKDLQNDMAEAEHQAKGADSEEEIADRLEAASDRDENLNDTVRRATDKAHEDQQG